MAYSLGFDFGTLSCRAFLLNLDDPRDTSSGVAAFEHGVMSEALPDGTELPGREWALQDATDYLQAARAALANCLSAGDPRRRQIVGIGVDFTASSPMPTDTAGRPLSADYPSEPHAYVKLWKHHRAEPWVERIRNAPGAERYLEHYGGQLSCEWLVPKAFELLESSPAMWNATGRFVEAGDWIVQQLTGAWTRNLCAAGFKGMWCGSYPDAGFLSAMHPEFGRLASEMLDGELLPPGCSAGTLTAESAAWFDLPAGIPVSAATIDAHSGLLGMGVSRAGAFGMIMGTSVCQLFVAPEHRVIAGVMGVVEGGILPGLFAYEAGQAAVGDLFSWYLEQLCPLPAEAESERHAILTEQARAIAPGSNGHVVLDWINGNRSVLLDPALSGGVFGLTLSSKPSEIYRACLESVVFGCRVIMDTVREAGVEFDEVVACGGITENQLLMQIYADVLGLPLRVSSEKETVACGAAMYGAMAAGFEDVAALAPPASATLVPDRAASALYEPVYREYRRLHDQLGREDDVLKRLRDLRQSS
ncbi:MAG: ribulokinase [Planctomycetota bacterium]|nr:ribulokinase [Planctomycetota bacterium]